MDIDDKNRKTYTAPEIVTELELETRAGSEMGEPDPLGDLGSAP